MKKLNNIAIIVFSLIVSISVNNVFANPISSPTQETPFMKLDKIEPYFKNIPNSDWKIVNENSQEEAFISHNIVEHGKTDSKGVINFTSKQRKSIYTKWNQTRGNIWLIVGNSIYVFSPDDNNGERIISIVYQGEKEEKLKDNNELLSKDKYTQIGFNEQKYEEDFLKWKITFTKELNDLMIKIKGDYKYGKYLLDPVNEQQLINTFNQSIEKSAKGLYLKKMIISAYYNTNRDVWSEGTTFTQLIKNENTKPIGYGGKTEIDNKDAEVLYMQFADLTQFTEQDFKESIVMSAFNQPQLPQYGVATRNVWPTLIFTRNEKNELVIVGVSSEMVKIMQRIFHAQIS